MVGHHQKCSWGQNLGRVDLDLSVTFVTLPIWSRSNLLVNAITAQGLIQLFSNFTEVLLGSKSCSSSMLTFMTLKIRSRSTLLMNMITPQAMSQTFSNFREVFLGSHFWTSLMLTTPFEICSMTLTLVILFRPITRKDMSFLYQSVTLGYLNNSLKG